MKGIFIVIDGVGDFSYKQLNNKTPLEAASTPFLDKLSKKSKLGLMYPIKEGVVPESDSSLLSIFNQKYHVGLRGWIEALGAGIELKHGDLALRTNFATIDNLRDKNILDRRAGRNLTTREAAILTKEINRKVKLPCKYIFKNTVHHRGVLVLKGGFSDSISNTDPAYHSEGKSEINQKFKFSYPLDEEEISEFTSNVINDFIEKSHKVLEVSRINEERRRRGLLPANIILTRDACTDLPKFRSYSKWASIVYMPLEIGISKVLKINPFYFEYPDLKSYDVYENLYLALKKACFFAIKVLKKQSKNYDYFYIHFKETDIPGHDNKPLEKKKMIELIDKIFFSFLFEFVEKKKIKVLITADHSTPSKLKSHSDNPVPVLFFNPENPDNKEKRFNEKEAENGELGITLGKDLLKRARFI